jgi:hypothetical protein
MSYSSLIGDKLSKEKNDRKLGAIVGKSIAIIGESIAIIGEYTREFHP